MRRSHCLGYCVPAPTPFGNPVMDRFLHAISEAAERRGYHVLLFTQPLDGADPRSAYEALLGQRADRRLRPVRHDRRRRPPAVAARPRRPVRRLRPALRRAARSARGSTSTAPPATAAAVRHLAALGHRRVAFIGWPEGSGVGDDRYRGCVEAAAGSELDDRRRRARRQQHRARAARSPTRLLAGRDAPTAFVCVSDVLALGCDAAVRADRPGARSRHRHHRLRRLPRRRPRRRVADERPPAPRRRRRARRAPARRAARRPRVEPTSRSCSNPTLVIRGSSDPNH